MSDDGPMDVAETWQDYRDAQAEDARRGRARNGQERLGRSFAQLMDEAGLDPRHYPKLREQLHQDEQEDHDS